MSRRQYVEIVDDLDGSPAVETLTYAVDGVMYEIDLNAQNAEGFRLSFAHYIEASRRIGGRSTKRSVISDLVATGPNAERKAEVKAIRDWARENGFSVSERGRIPALVMAAYSERLTEVPTPEQVERPARRRRRAAAG